MKSMATQDIPATATVTVFTRHNAGCTKKGDRAWKRCNCRKYLYVYAGGRDKTISAKTRSWERAERLAQAERERQLDPEKRKLQEESLQGKNITVAKAIDEWLATVKYREQRTLNVYMRAGRRIVAWAAEQKINNLADVTPAKLGQWQSTWGKEATEKYSRLGQASQGQFLDYLKQFCLWAANMGFVSMDPSRFLPSIPKSKEQTMPLTPQQFDALPAGVDAFTAAAGGEVREWAAELKALFKFQRWAGLRILDCLMFPRSGLVENRISLVTKKTGAKIENRVIPDDVAEALRAIPVDRPGWMRDYFFWPEGQRWETLSQRFTNEIGKLNRFLAFIGEDGKPLRFRSHMLRDTYAVELLLAGMPLEDVSKLLTHSSIRTTERHYSPWVKSRLQQLEDKSVEAMRKMGAKIDGR